MTKDKFRILIVEDDSIIAEDLAGYMEDFGYQAMQTASNAEEALKLLKHELPDLILLDVGLEGEIDGIQLAQLIQEKYDLPFIFLTAYHDDKTIERIKSTRPAGYLVKPIDERSLKTSIEVGLYNFKHSNLEVVDKESQDTRVDSFNEDHFFIKVKQGLQKILLKDILFFEAYDNYSYVHTHDKKHIVSMPLIAIENKIASKYFIRVHRSYIINIEKIQGIEDDNIIIDGKSIPIGKTYRSDIMKLIKLL
jgi:two-component system response regulator LytT